MTKRQPYTRHSKKNNFNEDPIPPIEKTVHQRLLKNFLLLEVFTFISFILLTSHCINAWGRCRIKNFPFAKVRVYSKNISNAESVRKLLVYLCELCLSVCVGFMCMCVCVCVFECFTEKLCVHLLFWGLYMHVWLCVTLSLSLYVCVCISFVYVCVCEF